MFLEVPRLLAVAFGKKYVGIFREKLRYEPVRRIDAGSR